MPCLADPEVAGSYPLAQLDYVPNKKFVPDEPVEVAISDNLGFGGHNAALVFKRYEA